MSCNCSNCNCEATTVHTPTTCHTSQPTTHSVRLYTLKCGSWVYAGQMPMNSAPTNGMRLLWGGKAYTIEQSTLTGSEPGTDKWEVMLIQAGPGYATTGCGNNAPHNQCMPCPPSTLPPLEPTGGTNHNSPCTDPWYNPPKEPAPWNHNTPRPVEMGLGCGPHYQCTGYPS
jgi:hypothetical protein